jgi:hypothetical protein
MEDWVDLRGMTPEAAKDYILAHMTDLNVLKQRIGEADAETASWEARVKLAAEKGLAELEAQAGLRLSEARARANALKTEAISLATDIKKMRDQVPGLEARVRSVDPDILLAGLQMVTGEMDHPGESKLNEAVASAQADDALAALKSSLGMAPPPPPEKPAEPVSEAMNAPETGDSPAATDPEAPNGESESS